MKKQNLKLISGAKLGSMNDIVLGRSSTEKKQRDGVREKEKDKYVSSEKSVCKHHQKNVKFYPNNKKEKEKEEDEQKEEEKKRKEKEEREREREKEKNNAEMLSALNRYHSSVPYSQQNAGATNAGNNNAGSLAGVPSTLPVQQQRIFKSGAGVDAGGGSNQNPITIQTPPSFRMPSLPAALAGSSSVVNVGSINNSVPSLQIRQQLLTAPIITPPSVIQTVTPVVGNNSSNRQQVISVETISEGIKLTVDNKDYFVYHGTDGLNCSCTNDDNNKDREEVKVKTSSSPTSSSPVIESLSKTAGSINDTVIITGNNFNRQAFVFWGEVTITDPYVMSINTIKVSVPKSSSKSILVRVSNPDWSLSNSVEFNYK